MTTCNVKGVGCSDEPKENYRRTLQFPSALWLIFQLIVFGCGFHRKTKPATCPAPNNRQTRGPDIFF